MWKCWLANFVKSCPRKPPSHQFASKGSACTQQILCEDCGTLFLAQWDKSLSGVIFLILYCPIIYLDFPNLYIKGGHSVLRLDATTKKRYDGKLLKFKKFSIKQAFFINEIFSSRVEASKRKKI